MKKLILPLAILAASCQKDSRLPPNQYRIRPDVFNKGAFQPSQPVTVIEYYTDPASGLPYAEVSDTHNVVWYLPKADLIR